MKELYLILRNSAVFFLITTLFGNSILLPTDLIYKLMLALGFGVMIFAIPFTLKFFKIPVNNASELLLGGIFCFVYFLIVGLILEIITFTGNTPEIFKLIGVVTVAEQTINLVYITIVSSIVAIGIDMLYKAR